MHMIRTVWLAAIAAAAAMLASPATAQDANLGRLWKVVDVGKSCHAILHMESLGWWSADGDHMMGKAGPISWTGECDETGLITGPGELVMMAIDTIDGTMKDRTVFHGQASHGTLTGNFHVTREGTDPQTGRWFVYDEAEWAGEFDASFSGSCKLPDPEYGADPDFFCDSQVADQLRNQFMASYAPKQSSGVPSLTGGVIRPDARGFINGCILLETPPEDRSPGKLGANGWGLKNQCGYAVRVSWCISEPPGSSSSNANLCARGKALTSEIGAYKDIGFTSFAEVGRLSVNLFACKVPAEPGMQANPRDLGFDDNGNLTSSGCP